MTSKMKELLCQEELREIQERNRNMVARLDDIKQALATRINPNGEEDCLNMNLAN